MRIRSILAAVSGLLLSGAAVAADQPPAEAVAAGYDRLVFDENFRGFDPSPDGFGAHRWYPLRSLGVTVPPSLTRQTSFGLRVTTPQGGGHGVNTSFATFPTGLTFRGVQPPPGPDGAGTPTFFQFGYFEARMRYDPSDRAWPAFWLASEAGLVNPKAPGARFCELDIMEGRDASDYGGTMHDWHDRKSTHNNDQRIHLPPGGSYRKWNRFGLLWQPGKVTWFLNGKPQRTLQSPEICDQDRLFLVFQIAKMDGAADHTLDVSSIRVWH